MNQKENILMDKPLTFALRIIKLHKNLKEINKEYKFNRKILRTGTLIVTNVGEAKNTQSKTNFIYKLSPPQKEFNESISWLECRYQFEFLIDLACNNIHFEANELLKIPPSSIITFKKHNL